MGFRFRRSLRIAPGLRINLSRSGVSTSIGRRGAWFTFGPRGTRETIGVPGSGVYYTAQQQPHPEQAPHLQQPASVSPRGGSLMLGLIILALLLLVAASFLWVTFGR